ncbi:MAG: hypothetical protein E7662_12405 [Ruminococcaceae bacterium]|nr:hypothetical protein [Oscillospiraceae bacterium]
MKKLCVILAVFLAISLTAFGTLLMWHQNTQYSHHRWFEGDRENVIGDVMENYAYPGASVQAMTEALGEGDEVDDDLAECIRQLGGWNDDGSDAVSLAQVRVYNIKTVNGRTTYYLAVVYENDRVLQTVLVSNKKGVEYFE